MHNNYFCLLFYNDALFCMVIASHDAFFLSAIVAIKIKGLVSCSIVVLM